ncbi:MAG: hypothetical protein HY712_06495 [candidate division NC10 bacterium]|nr:hypothetical protein [candidate division NC10 bacterium]
MRTWAGWRLACLGGSAGAFIVAALLLQEGVVTAFPPVITAWLERLSGLPFVIGVACLLAAVWGRGG